MRVPERIRELRAICQLSPQWQVEQPWAFLQIRKVSIYLTWILLHTPLYPNGVSILGILSGIAASVLLGMGHPLPGLVLLQLAIVLDFSDGEVSRYRKLQSKQGSYLDKVYHFTVHPAVFAGLTLGAYRARPEFWILVAGFVCAIGVTAYSMVMVHANDLAAWKHGKKLLDRLNAALDAEPRDRTALQSRLTTPMPPAPQGANEGIRQSAAARLVSYLSGTWDFPYIMFVITGAFLIQQLVPSLAFGTRTVTPTELVVLFYALTYPPWTGFFLSYILATRATDRAYEAFAGDLSRLLSRVSEPESKGGTLA